MGGAMGITGVSGSIWRLDYINNSLSTVDSMLCGHLCNSVRSVAGHTFFP